MTERRTDTTEGGLGTRREFQVDSKHREMGKRPVWSGPAISPR